MPHKDPDQRREYQAHWHRTKKAERRDRKRSLRTENREFVAQYKAERGCSVCGERDPVVLDLHHVLGKNAAIADAVNSFTRDRLVNELGLCIVVCANDHRRIHHSEKKHRPHWGKRHGQATEKPRRSTKVPGRPRSPTPVDPAVEDRTE